MTDRAQNLLGEVVVDEGGLQRQVAGGINRVALVLRGFGGRFADSQQVKIRVVTLVKEKLVAHALDDYVPRVAGARAAHQRGQDGIRGKYIALCFRQLRYTKELL